jgi:hypothetical protein
MLGQRSPFGPPGLERCLIVADLRSSSLQFVEARPILVDDICVDLALGQRRSRLALVGQRFGLPGSGRIRANLKNLVLGFHSDSPSFTRCEVGHAKLAARERGSLGGAPAGRSFSMLCLGLLRREACSPGAVESAHRAHEVAGRKVDSPIAKADQRLEPILRGTHRSASQYSPSAGASPSASRPLLQRGHTQRGLGACDFERVARG